jgi:uncharacterized coiled-coil DUF342 family protein
MSHAKATKRQAQTILDKLRKRARVTDEELELLQQHIDVIESAAEGEHQHHHHSP